MSMYSTGEGAIGKPRAKPKPKPKPKQSKPKTGMEMLGKPKPPSRYVAKPKPKTPAKKVGDAAKKVATKVTNTAKRASTPKRSSGSSNKRSSGSSNKRTVSSGSSSNKRSSNKGTTSKAPEPKVTTASVPEEPKKEKVISFEDFIASDSPYSAAYNEIRTGLDTAKADYGRGRNDLNRSMFDSLQSLGLDFQDIGPEQLNPNEIRAAKWNASDTNRGYGQGRDAMTSSAASRGMLDSSFFADELTNYDTQFNDQRSKLLQQLVSGQGEYDAQEANAYQAANSSVYNAVTDAADRYAAQFGVDAPTADLIKEIVDGRKFAKESKQRGFGGGGRISPEAKRELLDGLPSRPNKWKD